MQLELFKIKNRHSIKSALSLKFFECVVNLEEISVVVVTIYFVKVLVPAVVEISVAQTTQQTTMFQLGFESMPNQVNVVELKCFRASANVTEGMPFQKNTLDFRATCSQMFATGYLLRVPPSLLHSAPPQFRSV